MYEVPFPVAYFSIDPLDLYYSGMYLNLSGTIHVPTPKHRFAARVASMWDRLPAEIVASNTVAIFRRKLEDNLATIFAVAP